MEELIAAGHPVDTVWGYTPRQVNGYLLLASRRAQREAALDLSIASAGARGEPREVRDTIKKWEKAEPRK